jgi:FMN phosphatase YigB (HAD superfamily)
LSNITARIISSEVGAGKPQPAFFEAVLATCDCPATELLMIGDDYENDVAAPRQLGIAAWHLDRGDGADDVRNPVFSKNRVSGHAGAGDALYALSDLVDRLPATPGVG